MGRTKKAGVSALGQTPSRTVLNEVPMRVLLFLRGVSTNPMIRDALAKGGFAEAEHREGWALLSNALSYPRVGYDPDADLKARAALDEIETWVKTQRQRLAVAIARLHPKESALFETSAVAERDAITLSVVLKNIAALEARAAKSPSAQAVLQTLTRRGFDARERERLRELLDRAQRVLNDEDPRLNRELEAANEAQQKALVALYHWHVDWSATAHLFIKRRDLLLMLGLVSRKKRNVEAAEALPPKR